MTRHVTGSARRVLAFAGLRSRAHPQQNVSALPRATRPPSARAGLREAGAGLAAGRLLAAAPRLAQCDPNPDQLRWLWAQVVEAMIRFGAQQLVHGDLSPFNVLVTGLSGPEPELVIIDVPQVLDLVSNPNGVEYLHRDCRNMADWFVRKGLQVDADVLLADVLAAAW